MEIAVQGPKPPKGLWVGVSDFMTVRPEILRRVTDPNRLLAEKNEMEGSGYASYPRTSEALVYHILWRLRFQECVL